MTTPDITKIKREMREAAEAAMFNGKPTYSLSINPAAVLALLADHDALAAERDTLRKELYGGDGTANYGWITPASYKKIADENDALRAERDALARQGLDPAGGAAAMWEALEKIAALEAGNLSLGDQVFVVTSARAAIRALPIPAAPPSAPGDALQRDDDCRSSRQG